MATLFEITYEAGSAGNSVGAESGWDTFTGTRVYEAAAAEQGSLGVKITDQATFRKNITATNKWRLRWYHKQDAADPLAPIPIAVARSSTTVRAQVRVETGGTYRLVNVSTATGSSSGTLTANISDRLEWAVDGDAGTQTLYLFKGSNRNGNTPDETLTGTYTNATADNIGAAWFTSVVGMNVRQDEVKCTDTPGTLIGGFSNATVTPTVIALSVTINSAAVPPNPATIALSVTIPTPTIRLSATVVATTVALSAVIPAPTITVPPTVANATATPAVVALAVTIDGLAGAVSSTISVDRVDVVLAVPSPSIGAITPVDATATPATVTLQVTVVPPEAVATDTTFLFTWDKVGFYWESSRELRYRIPVAISLVKVGTEWREVQTPSEELVSQASYYFPGGRVHRVTGQVAQELLLAGYSDYITVEE